MAVHSSGAKRENVAVATMFLLPFLGNKVRLCCMCIRYTVHVNLWFVFSFTCVRSLYYIVVTDAILRSPFSVQAVLQYSARGGG